MNPPVLRPARGDDAVGTGALDGAAVRSVFVRPQSRRRSTPAARPSHERHAFRTTGEAWFGEERTIVMERDACAAFAPARRM